MTRLIISLLLVTSFFTAPPLRAQEPKLPEPIQALMPAIVTVTRIEPVDPSVEESAKPKPLSHVGVFVDPRGYIVIPMLPCSTQPKLFVVRFANQQETMGELAAVDESLKVGVLKIARPLPVKAVSIDKSREARRDERVLLVRSSASHELRSGRVLTTTFDLGKEGSAKLIQADVACPLSEFGSLMVSEAGEPIGLVLASRTNPQPVSIALPLKAIQTVLQAAIDKPKDVPLVRVAESSPAIDLHRPVPITLQPVSPLATSLVELFAPRGARILEHEEGKRLKIEAPPLVLEELTKQLSQVLREQQKPEATTAQPTDTPADVKMPDISGKWTFNTPDLLVKELKGASVVMRQTYVVSRSEEPGIDFVILESRQPKADASRVKWIPGTRRFQAIPKDEKDNAKGQTTLELSADGNTLSARVVMDAAEKKRLAAEGGVTGAEMERLLNQEWRRAGPDEVAFDSPLKEPVTSPTLEEDLADRIQDLVGTWSRAESGTFSKLTIWPVENRELMIFVEGPDFKGLLEWKPEVLIFGGFITFNALGDWTVKATLRNGSNETQNLVVTPFEGQRKELLRSGFAKTERELDQKLRTLWTRTAAPAQPNPVPTVTVVKTEFNPAPVLDALRAKYREPPYRFFSNDTFQSVIAIAPEEAQEEIEVLIHKLDVEDPQKRNDQAASPSIAQQSPANQPQEEETDETKFFHLRSSDATTMLTVVEKLFQGRIRRISADRRTNSLIVVALPSVCSEVEAVVLKLDSTPSRQRPAEANHFSQALPDTPAAKQLVEQLGAQESAAAAEAATIRQLQANGQAEQNRQAIAEHQRKLKNLLSTAFDLKLQLEELQVQELQSRLSRLERQIGQRKKLREKIINRRAGELIEGDALRWDAASPATTKVPGLAVKDSAPGAMSSSSTTAAVTKADHIEIDLYAGSQVLPGLGKNPGYSKLVQSLNALKGVTVNIREAGQGDMIVMAIVRDPSQRCQREARQTQKESELRIAINSALKAAGIEATRWDESAAVENAESKSADEAETQTGSLKSDPTAVLLAKLQGRWDLDAHDPEGIPIFAEIKGDIVTIWRELGFEREDAETTQLKFGEPGPPQRIDLIMNPNDGKSRTVMQGIIEFTDDMVRICFNHTAESQRPEVFAIGKKTSIWELRRKPKSGESMPDLFPSTKHLREQLSKSPKEATSLNADDVAALISRTLGVTFGQPVETKGGHSFRGGLPIVKVFSISPGAPEIGFREGDILVGLHVWETPTLNDVVYALRHWNVKTKGENAASVRSDDAPLTGINQANDSVSFVRAYILRGEDLLYTNIVLPAKTEASGKSMTIDDWIAVLRDERDVDRVVEALYRLRSVNLGDRADRAAPAILSAMEFHDPYIRSKPEQLPPAILAKEALTAISRSAKTPALVKALRDGHPRVKLVAVWSLANDSSLWEYAKEPDFPALAEQLLVVATGPDELPKAACLNVLAKTLPLTKIGLAEITTNERREALRKFGEAFPREQVRQLIVKALNDTHIDVVLTAGQLVLEMLNELPDLDVKARLVDVPTKIVEGKFHDVAASESQRGQALGLLAKLRDRSAPAVPLLIKLLKSSDVEFPVVPGTNPRFKRDGFTREKVILTLGAIGPLAKDALPILEAELAELDKQEKEDDLLSGATKLRDREPIGSTPASVLRLAISSIKGERTFPTYR